jgi:hypothetical protein
VVIAKGSAAWVTSPLWLPVSVVVALLVGAGLMWLTWQLVYARRRIAFSLNVVEMFQGTNVAPGQLLVSYDGRSIGQPRLMQLRLVARSGRDIPRSAFEDTPLLVELRATVVAVLDVTSEPAGTTPPEFLPESIRLRMEPLLLRAGQVVTVTVLADGGPAEDFKPVVMNMPVDVRPAYRSWGAFTGPRWKDPDLRRGGILLVVMLALIVAGLLINVAQKL